MTKVLGQCVAGDFRDRAGHFNASWSATDDDKIHRCLACRFVCCFFGKFEGQKNPSPELNRILKTLQSRREVFPLVVPKIRMPRPGRENEVVIFKYLILRSHFFAFDIHRLHLGKDYLDILAFAQDCAHRGSNVSW